jgi:cobalt-zinc-cadmium efflux system protein
MIRFLKNIMGLWLLQRSLHIWKKDNPQLDYQKLTALATAAKPFAAFINPDDERFFNPQPIKGVIMLSVAVIGLIANILSMYLLQAGSKESLNVRSAYLHMLSDAISSVAVIAGGVAIILWDVYWIDPLLTVLIAIYVLKGGWDILKETTHILMMGTPADISIKEISNEIEKLDEIDDVHHIHIWALKENTIHLEAHIKVQDMPVSKTEIIRADVEHLLREKYHIDHLTLQFEAENCSDNH